MYPKKVRTPMTLTVELKPEVEAGLLALARAKGVPLDAYLRSLLEQLAASSASLGLETWRTLSACRVGTRADARAWVEMSLDPAG